MIALQQRNKFYAILCLIFAVLAISWSSKVDEKANEQISESIVEASAIWVVARSINRIVSVVQETEVAIPFLDNLKIKPLELLDPVNDAIERFSGLMTYAISSLAAQKILASVAGNYLLNILLTISLLSYAVAFYLNVPWIEIAKQFALTFGLIRFSLVLVILMNAALSHAFLDKEIEREAQDLRVGYVVFEELQDGITLDEKTQKKATSLEARINFKKSELVTVEKHLTEARFNLKKLETELDALDEKEGCDLWEIGCKEGGRLISAKNKILELEDKIDADTVQQKVLLDEIDALKDKSACLIKKSRGESCSFSEILDINIKRLKSPTLTQDIYQSIQDKLEKLGNWFSSIPNLMALIMLKTIVLPLMFWFGIYKLLKRIWRQKPVLAK